MAIATLNVLFVEDSQDDVWLMVKAIRRIGYQVVWACVETEAGFLVALQENNWDVVICDYRLPHFEPERAFQTLRKLHQNIPFLLVSGVVNEEIALPLIDMGVNDFIDKNKIWRLPLAIRRELRAVSERFRQQQILDQAFQAIIHAWGSALDLRDHSTQGHTLRVTNHALIIATRNHVPPRVLQNVYFGSLLHDIGKMGIPDSILNKPDKLTPEEWVIMRQHPILAKNFLQDISFLRDATDIPYCHHEHYDGSGYPRGLKGDEIPVSARIFSLADVYDSLTHDRPYRKAVTPKIAIQTMKELQAWFDPDLFQDFLENEGADNDSPQS